MVEMQKISFVQAGFQAVASQSNHIKNWPIMDEIKASTWKPFTAYRTRDSAEIYVALRLPVLRKLLDVNTRKAFRDILDLHGGL